MIPEKIIIDTPLPKPLSVICSPSHVTIMLPAVRIVPINRYVETFGVLTNEIDERVLKLAVIPID